MIRTATCLALSLGACADPALEREQGPIINGSPSQPGEYPAVGALVVDSGNGQQEFFCTGTLIAPDLVLTAGHCVDDFFLGDQMPGFTLVLDTNVLAAADVVPGLARRSNPGWMNGDDIGLLKLRQGVTGITPGVLPSVSEGQAMNVGMDLEIAGYGMHTLDDMVAGVKYDAITRLASIDAQAIGVGNPGDPQNCRGDSGGPAFAAVGPAGALRVVGVVSGGPEPCNQGGFDTRVDAYLDWVSATRSELDALSPDAGVVEPDAGTAEPDAGGPAPGDDDGGGCGCSVGGSRRAALPGLALLAGLVVLVGRRRR